MSLSSPKTNFATPTWLSISISVESIFTCLFTRVSWNWFRFVIVTVTKKPQPQTSFVVLRWITSPLKFPRQLGRLTKQKESYIPEKAQPVEVQLSKYGRLEEPRELFSGVCAGEDLPGHDFAPHLERSWRDWAGSWTEQSPVSRKRFGVFLMGGAEFGDDASFSPIVIVRRLWPSANRQPIDGILSGMGGMLWRGLVLSTVRT